MEQDVFSVKSSSTHFLSLTDRPVQRSSQGTVRSGALAALFVLLLVGALGCYDYSSTGGRATTNNVRSLATQGPAEKQLVAVNVLGVAAVKSSEEGQIPQAVLSGMNDQLLQTFEGELTLEVQSLMDLNLHLSDPEGIRRSLQAAAGKGVDALLVTTLDKYRERRGSRVGVEEGAEVAFRMRLLEVRTGQEVWQAQYHYRDQPLSDNLFDMRSRTEAGAGPGWKRASQLAAGAFRAAARDIAERRNRLFLSRQ